MWDVDSSGQFRAAVGMAFQSPYPSHTHRNPHWNPHGNPHTHGSPAGHRMSTRGPCRGHKSQIGDRSFTAAGLDPTRLWNNLPVERRQWNISCEPFNRLLKKKTLKADLYSVTKSKIRNKDFESFVSGCGVMWLFSLISPVISIQILTYLLKEQRHQQTTELTEAGFPANATHATNLRNDARNVRNVTIWRHSLDRPITGSQPPATTAYAPGTLPSCDRQARTYWN